MSVSDTIRQKTLGVVQKVGGHGGAWDESKHPRGQHGHWAHVEHIDKETEDHPEFRRSYDIERARVGQYDEKTLEKLHQYHQHRVDSLELARDRITALGALKAVHDEGQRRGLTWNDSGKLIAADGSAVTARAPTVVPQVTPGLPSLSYLDEARTQQWQAIPPEQRQSMLQARLSVIEQTARSALADRQPWDASNLQGPLSEQGRAAFAALQKAAARHRIGLSFISRESDEYERSLSGARDAGYTGLAGDASRDWSGHHAQVRLVSDFMGTERDVSVLAHELAHTQEPASTAGVRKTQAETARSEARVEAVASLVNEYFGIGNAPREHRPGATYIADWQDQTWKGFTGRDRTWIIKTTDKLLSWVR